MSSSSTTVSGPMRTVGIPGLMSAPFMIHGRTVVAGLGGTDGFRDDQVREPLEELVLHGRREHRGSARDRHERRRVVVGFLERFDERARHRVTRDAQAGDAMLLDRLPHFVARRTSASAPAILPLNRLPSVPHCAAPCISGAMTMLFDLVCVRRGRLRESVLVGDLLAAVEVDPSAEHADHVFLAPHDTLRHAGGAAGVEDVDVVLAALGRSRARVTATRARRRTAPNRCRSSRCRCRRRSR